MTSIRQSLPAFRAFVFGQEVTADVSNVNTNWNDDGRHPAISELVLSSVNDRYVLNTQDMGIIYKDLTPYQMDPNQLNGDQDSIDQQIVSNINNYIIDPIKSRILGQKVNVRVPNVTQDPPGAGLEMATVLQPSTTTTKGIGQTNSIPAFSGDVARFPFQVGQCIFHTGDPVTVFMRDPLTGVWFFGARGFVSDCRESVSVQGKRTVTLNIEGPLRLFKLARTTLNPAIYDLNVVTDPAFDSILRTWYSEPFPDKTLAEILYSITFGDSPSAQSGSGSSAGSTVIGAPDNVNVPVKNLSQFRYSAYSRPVQIQNWGEYGVGSFNLPGSQIYLYGSTTTSGNPVSKIRGKEFITLPTAQTQPFGSLEAWQTAIDHIVPTKILADFDDPKNILSLCSPEFRQNELEDVWSAYTDKLDNVSVDEVMTHIGEHPELYPVDYGRLMILLPVSLGPGTNRDLMMKDLADGVGSRTEFVSRLQVIYNVCERIGFSFYETPRGDIICEMPMYSNRPEDFGVYADRYRFGLEDTVNFDSHFEDEKVRTVFRCAYNVAPNVSLGNSQTLWSQPGTKSMKALIPQFGLRIETADPWGFIHSPQAASYYSALRLSQLNQNAWTINPEVVMRLGLGPNRPCWFEIRDFIATLRHGSESLAWGKSGHVKQQIGVNYRRGWSGLMVSDQDGNYISGSDGNPLHAYEPYGGKMADPLDYATLFSNPSNETQTSTKQDNSTITITSGGRKYQIDKTVALNLQKVVNTVGIIADDLIAQGSTGTKEQLVNAMTQATYRDVASNAEAHGKVNSFHLDGLATDIGQNALAQFTIGGVPLTPEYVADRVAALKLPSASPNGPLIESSTLALLEQGSNPNSTTPDHLHLGIGEASGRRTSGSGGAPSS